MPFRCMPHPTPGIHSRAYHFAHLLTHHAHLPTPAPSPTPLLSPHTLLPAYFGGLLLALRGHCLDTPAAAPALLALPTRRPDTYLPPHDGLTPYYRWRSCTTRHCFRPHLHHCSYILLPPAGFARTRVHTTYACAPARFTHHRRWSDGG